MTNLNLIKLLGDRYWSCQHFVALGDRDWSSRLRHFPPPTPVMVRKNYQNFVPLGHRLEIQPETVPPPTAVMFRKNYQNFVALGDRLELQAEVLPPPRQSCLGRSDNICIVLPLVNHLGLKSGP